MMKQGKKAFTVIELLVVISIMTMLMALLLPSLAAARDNAKRIENANNLRSLQAGLVLRGHDNNGWYPGYDSSGSMYEPDTDERFEELFKGSYTNGKAAISPSETITKTPWSSGNASSANFSYAMPSLWNLTVYFSWWNYTALSRNDAWRDDSNSQTPVLSDRAILNSASSSWGFYIKSIHTNPEVSYQDWQGNVAWNDNHVTWESDSQVDTKIDGNRNNNDDLFRNEPDTMYRVSSRAIYTSETDAFMSARNSYGTSSE